MPKWIQDLCSTGKKEKLKYVGKEERKSLKTAKKKYFDQLSNTCSTQKLVEIHTTLKGTSPTSPSDTALVPVVDGCFVVESGSKIWIKF